jgi:hypothetical protein
MTITRSLLATGLLAAGAAAAPVLTTIQDVLYKADGTRFNGSLIISWNGFQAADNTTVVTQTSRIKVVDGNLKVQLVPSTSGTPARTYSVTYSGDGKIMFAETWSIPSSGVPLKVKDVRVSTISGSSGGGSVGQITGTVEETDVNGLVADLTSRPLKGPGFAPGRVAIIGSTGGLEGAIGADTDCVRVDGSAGPCGVGGGGVGPSFIDGEALAGLVDGANLSFTVNATPDPPGSLLVFRNGLLQALGSDYTISGRNIQFIAAATPQAGDTLLVSYRLGTVDSGTPQIFPAAQVLCSGLGAAANSPSSTSIGTCSVPPGTLVAGDRVEVRFNFDHQGTASNFSVDVLWGTTTLVHRDAASAETQVTGRSEIGVVASGAQTSSQSWGAVLPLTATVGAAADSYTGGLTIDFRASVPVGGDIVTLRNFTVIRYP